jgi:hypothetical protein
MSESETGRRRRIPKNRLTRIKNFLEKLNLVILQLILTLLLILGGLKFLKEECPTLLSDKPSILEKGQISHP